MTSMDDRNTYEPARRAPRRRVEAINDLAPETRRTNHGQGSLHPTDGRPSRSRQGRGKQSRDPRARNVRMPQLKQDLHYGQYLSVPHGSRSIFAGAEQRSRKRGIVITVSVAAAVILVLVIILRMTACSG